VLIVVGGAPAPAGSDRAAQAGAPPPRYPMLVEHIGLPNRSVIRRAVRRAVARERRRGEAVARRQRVAEVRRAVARTRATAEAQMRVALRRELRSRRAAR